MDAALKPRRRRRWPYLLLILLLGFAAYTAFVLRWSYSDGERVGILQKLSHKGFVCKTTEGELALYVVAGMSPQIWSFTVRDAKVAQRLNTMLGQRTRLQYYVDDASLENPGAAPPGAAAPAMAPAPAPAPKN